jgi:hypothetical protein
MAELYIKFSTVLCRHRKLADLARLLKIRRAHAAGHLAFLWCAALEQQEDGDLSSWSDGFLAECADFKGDAEKFTTLLIDRGFLDKSRLIHDWLDYVGPLLRTRYASGNRDHLTAIWAKHGRVYAEPVTQPKRNGNATATQPTTREDQPSLAKSSEALPPQPMGEGGAVEVLALEYGKPAALVYSLLECLATDKNIRNPMAVAKTRLANQEFPPPPTPKIVCRWINELKVVAVAGIQTAPPAKCNAQGIYLDGRSGSSTPSIPAASLTFDAIEWRKP